MSEVSASSNEVKWASNEQNDSYFFIIQKAWFISQIFMVFIVAWLWYYLSVNSG